MRTIARDLEENGYAVEYILCSGDPDSLDGIFIPELKTGFVDGTAPHVIEPKYPAAAEQYINLGTFYDVKALKNKRPKSLKSTASIKPSTQKPTALFPARPPSSASSIKTS